MIDIDAEDFDPTTEAGIEVMLEWLQRDGDLACPGSRYGRHTSNCAPWAVAMLLIGIDANGPPDAPISDVLDYDMGLVVNDSDGPLELVANYSHVLADVQNVDVHYVLDEAEALLREQIGYRLERMSVDQLRSVDEFIDTEHPEV